jgi:hypothetical protein
VVTPKATNRYPRPGERIAPYTLREFLLETVPSEFRSHCGDMKLCDLDETVWDRLPTAVLERLAEVVLERVAAAHVRKAFQHRHFPRPPQGLAITALRLENRTRRCLAREGFDEHLERLGEHTIGEILSIRAFGPRCLVDLLSALESPRHLAAGHLPASLSDQAGLSHELTEEALRLAQVPGIASIQSDDPRLGPLVRAADVEARNVHDLTDRLLARNQDPPDPAYLAEHVRQLRAEIERMPQLTLEEELIAIFTANATPRNAEIVIGYYGWTDGRQHTLTEVGNRYGITRERVRQICAKLARKPKLRTIYAPVMDRALAMIAQALPGPVATIEAELTARGWTRVGLSLESVATAARLVGHTADFSVVEVPTGRKTSARLAVRGQAANAVLAIVDAAKKSVYFHGLSRVDDIQRSVATRFPNGADLALVRQTLRLIQGFSWLDEQAGWFRITSIAKHGLPRTIEKVLAVAGTVTVEQLRAALARNRRLWQEVPSEQVLLEFCRHMPQVRVDGKCISSDPPRDWRTVLTGVELKLVRMLKTHDPVMERSEMEDVCVTEGMNRFSFHAFVSWSPVIVQLGHSLYGLLGAEVPQRQLASLVNARRVHRLARRVLDSHGRLADGRVWLRYRLSKAASTYAVITVPAALKKEIRGRFTLLTEDGAAIGTLATKDGRAWGLGAFLRQRGARIDDSIVLTLDLERRTATVAWSQSSGTENKR